MTIPTQASCLVLLHESASDSILRHSLVVNAVAVDIAKRLVTLLPEGTIDIGLVDCASLLHDIAKPPTENHEQRGALMILEFGAGFEKISATIAEHGIQGNPTTWEQIIVNYADKLVKHSEVVSLNERLDDLKSRRPNEAKAFEEARLQLQKLEGKITNTLGMTAEELVAAIQQAVHTESLTA